jgi:hypothetical protein
MKMYSGIDLHSNNRENRGQTTFLSQTSGVCPSTQLRLLSWPPRLSPLHPPAWAPAAALAGTLDRPRQVIEDLGIAGLTVDDFSAAAEYGKTFGSIRSPDRGIGAGYSLRENPWTLPLAESLRDQRHSITLEPEAKEFLEDLKRRLSVKSRMKN